MSDNLNKVELLKLAFIPPDASKDSPLQLFDPNDILQLINNEKIAELKRLKQIDAFNEAYSSDPRPSRLVDIRIKELKATLKKGSE